MSLGWRYAFASVIGASHEKIGLPCQDASGCRVLRDSCGEPVLIAVVSDGAGSAQRAETGSHLACSLLMEEMAALFETGGQVSEITPEFFARWIERFHHEISACAEAEEMKPRDFACTLLAAALGVGNAAFMQIGDGAIVIASPEEPEEYNWVFWPQKGEYENMTTFATEETAAEKMEYAFIEQRVEEAALFSDGLQRLALHFQTQTAHTPFFRPIFGPMRGIEEGFAEELSCSLAAFLSSPQVNARTDDDKSLILATRRINETPPINEDA